jgi:hypothetical protein
LAAARRIPNSPEVQLPDRQADTAAAPEYVKTDAVNANSETSAVQGTTQDVAATATTVAAKTKETASPLLKPIDNSIKTLKLNETSDVVKPDPVEIKPINSTPVADPPIDAAPSVKLRLGTDIPEMKTGDKMKIPVVIDGSGKFRSAVMGLKFDEKKLAIRSVIYGDVFVNTSATPFINQNGKMYISLAARDATDANLSGTLAYIEVEALAPGRPAIEFVRDMFNFMTVEGKSYAIKFDE